MMTALFSFKKKTAAVLCIAAGLILHSLAFAQSGCDRFFFNPQDVYSHNTANPAPTPFSLQQGQALGEVKYKVRGEPDTFTLEQYLTKFCTTGFLVLKDDQIVFERYLQGRKASDKLLSAS